MARPSVTESPMNSASRKYSRLTLPFSGTAKSELMAAGLCPAFTVAGKASIVSHASSAFGALSGAAAALPALSLAGAEALSPPCGHVTDSTGWPANMRATA